VRTALLIFAAIVTLVAFTFLHESRPGRFRLANAGFNARFGRLLARYRKPPDKA
jgi:hypothetical protein